jgi:lipopolysaccharide heptosyltransferase I
VALSRVLIVRTSALGDIVHTLPLATALRRHLPAARIGWVVERRFAPLLADHPAVDVVLEVALEDWRRRPFAPSSWRQLIGFSTQLGAFAPEVVIDAMGNHKSALLCALSLADRRIGARHADRREPSSALWINEPVTLRGEHAVDRTLSLLRGLEIEEETVDFGGPGLFPRTTVEEATPPILIHPGAGWRNKEYPPDRWGRVATELTAATGLEVGVLGGPGEQELAAAVAQAAGGQTPVVRAPTLDSLTAHLRRARLLLAGDTGPLHLAQAVGTRVLCILGPTDPVRNGAYGSPEGNIVHELPCSFCYKRLDEPKACLLAIDPLAVVLRAAGLVAAD